MTSCWACEAPLEPAWKFCIRCGVSVAAGADAAPTVTPKREAVSAYALFGWIMAALGGALLAAGVIMFLVTR